MASTAPRCREAEMAAPARCSPAPSAAAGRCRPPPSNSQTPIPELAPAPPDGMLWGLFNRGQVVCLFLLKPPSSIPMQSKVNDGKILSKMFVTSTQQETISTAGKHPLATPVVGSYQKLLPRYPDVQLWEGLGKTPLPSSRTDHGELRTSFTPPYPAMQPRADLGWACSFNSPAGHSVQQRQRRLLLDMGKPLGMTSDNADILPYTF